MKYLIVGLGNVGSEYEDTRHNSGFMAADALCESGKGAWSLERLAYRAQVRVMGRELVLVKPTTYMNLSGKAVRYWMQQEKVPLERLLVLVDDIALPVGTLRMKKGGSGGGHNGLGDIETVLGTDQYARLRIGVGNNFPRGKQIDYVLGRFDNEERAVMNTQLGKAVEMIKCFATQGADKAMSLYNGK
ncbi:MAG: aminoacyl-tRNA hydrolase [Bacteroidales bacterium]|nr:aminoacyl-tRNA hydrolase [Bacteroidales bacterium]